MIDDRIKHCYSCGHIAQTLFTEGKNRRVCSVCQLILYENPNPASSVLFIKENQILLVKRALEPRKDLWALPGGYQELDETPEQAAKREMYEETGLKSDKMVLFDLFYNDQSDKPVNVAVFFTQDAQGQLQAGDDVSDVAFFPINNLPDPLAFHYIYHCLKKLSAIPIEAGVTSWF
ncbi:MAG: NUDIX hydrolase [Proteobacteria bacterium]|nr:NUDIX hydrolase [Pseudomonadota bacterium]